jgi:hypothetical protein
LSTIRRAARLMRAASATEVPPNFMTTIPAIHRRILAAAAHAASARAARPADRASMTGDLGMFR